MSLKVLTWNVGTDERYKEMLQRAGDTPPDKPERLVGLRDNRAKFAFDFLIEANAPDIMFLQEIGSDLTRIKSWVGGNFEIISDGKDTAIAYRNSFEVIASHFPKITENRKFTILTLKDKLTEKIYNVASAHISGFDLKNPMKGRPSAPEGDKELEELLSKLNEREVDGTIIGLDANTTRDHYPAKLEILKREGFRTNDKDTAPTTYHKDLKGRVKLDYIYTRGFTFDPFEGLNLDLEKPITCPSDHIPVIEQLTLDSTSIEKSKAPAAAAPPDLDESFEIRQFVSVEEDKNDPDVRKHLKRLGFALTPSPSSVGKGGTLRASSRAEPFSLFSESLLAQPSPGAEPAEASPTPDGSGDYLHALGAMLGKGPTPPPLFESERDKSPDGLTGPSSGAVSGAVEEEAPLPALDTLGVEGLQAALDATVVEAALEDVQDLLGDRDLEGDKSAAEIAAEAAAKAKAKEAALARAPTRALPPAPAKARAPVSAAPTREAPALPIAGEADAAKTVKASAAVAAAMLARTSPAPSKKAVAARKAAEASAVAAERPAGPSPASRKEKPETTISCMRQTAIVATGIFVAVVIPFVGSFYRVE